MGAAVFSASTPLVYALTERATHDQIPLLAVGIGRADASDGRVFPYLFNPPTTGGVRTRPRSGSSANGLAAWTQLKGLKIAHVYIDNDFGRETLPLLDTQAAQYGFAVQHLAVPPPGLDQKATWLRVKVAQPDWVILRSTGVMTPTALKEAAQVGFPRDKIVGNRAPARSRTWCRPGRRPLASSAPPFWARGPTSRSSRRCSTYVYARGKGPGPEGDVGTAFWKRGVLDGVLTTEAIRTAMRHFGNQPLTGAQVQWGLEHLTLTAASTQRAGGGGPAPPVHPVVSRS